MATKCPLIKKPCLKHDCEWYVHVTGQDPQTGREVDQFGCTMVFLPMLLIENSQQQRHTGAAVESFRNEMVKSNHQATQVVASMINQQLQHKAGQK